MEQRLASLRRQSHKAFLNGDSNLAYRLLAAHDVLILTHGLR
jgi:hypothetical protein